MYLEVESSISSSLAQLFYTTMRSLHLIPTEYFHYLLLLASALLFFISLQQNHVKSKLSKSLYLVPSLSIHSLFSAIIFSLNFYCHFPCVNYIFFLFPKKWYKQDLNLQRRLLQSHVGVYNLENVSPLPCVLSDMIW